MKIAIAGGSGFLGKNLVSYFRSQNNEVILINRKDLYNNELLLQKISGCDVVINLAGSGILKRWTKENKKLISDSRVITGRNITNCINSLPLQFRPKTYLTASAIGIYKSGIEHDESSLKFDEGFVGTLVKNWEESSSELDKSVRRIVFRIGLVLGAKAKIIDQLLPVFRFGLGGKLGSGKQAFPFIHIKDFIKAVDWAISRIETEGVYNIVAPDYINNKQFTASFAKVLNRAAIFSVPGFLIKAILGNASSLILSSPIVSPVKLQKEGFIFDFPEIDICLKDIIQK